MNATFGLACCVFCCSNVAAVFLDATAQERLSCPTADYATHPMATDVRKLGAPPINEVVCGFVYETIVGLTPPVHGIYWEKRRESFATCEIHPAIVDGPSMPLLVGSALPARTWLVSADGVRLVQMQQDRFYVNWRRRGEGDTYPRFSRGSDGAGLLAFALDEFAQFCDFCTSRLGNRPKLVAVDLSKIDVLKQGTHWSDWQDLGTLVPAISSLLSSVRGIQPELTMRVSGDGQSASTMSIDIASGLEIATRRPVLRIETRGRTSAETPEGLESDFRTLNHELNGAFFRLISTQGISRFKPEA